MTREMIFTSESVTPGHPDKLCDRISDAAIDALLREDPGARGVVETALATGVLFIAARHSADARLDLASLARQVILDAGYVSADFDARRCSILTSISELPRAPAARNASPDRASREQANAFGYACRDTAELMPAPIAAAHRVARALDALRRGPLPTLSPDAKTQVSVAYRDGRPLRIHAIALTVAFEPDPPADAPERLRQAARDALAGFEVRMDDATVVAINAGGPLEIGGPARHAGLTGRKSGIDGYGEIARQSGSALSGKDPSRIDRTGAYGARHAAKSIVAAGLADRCEVHLAYAIGQPRPLSLAVETFGTGRRGDDEIAARLAEAFDFRPEALVERFRLRTRPRENGSAGFYLPLATYGHFGRTDLDLPWEAVAVDDGRGDLDALAPCGGDGTGD